MTVILSLVVYFIVIVIISWYSRNASRSQAFVIGNRQIGLLGTFAALTAGSFDGTGLIIVIMFGITMGFGAAWFLLGTAVGFGILALQAPKIRAIAAQYSILNITDFLRVRIGPLTERLATGITLCTSFFTTAGQLYVTGLIFHAATGYPQWLGITIGGSVVMLYTIIGGYVTLVRTDIFQWCAATIILAIAFIFGNKPSVNVIWTQLCGMPIEWKLGCILLLAFMQYGPPDTWQRIFSARNDKVARYGILLGIPIQFVYMFGALTIGSMIATAIGKHDASDAFYRYLSSTAIPSWLAAALGLLAMAKVMSALDTRAYVFISIFCKTVLRIDPEQRLTDYVSATRIGSLIYFTVSIVVAIFISDVVQYMFNVCSIIAILSPVLFVAVLANSKLKNLDIGMFCAVTLGVLTFLSLLTLGKLTTPLATTMPLITSLILTVLAYLVVLASQPKNETIQEAEAKVSQLKILQPK